MVDVSQADDMSEVMAAADVFITDYSSAAFDAINMCMPVFLYADDLKEYTEERGKLMWDMDRLPFDVVQSNEALCECIREFNEERYRDAIGIFLRKHGVLEDGEASKRVVNVIDDF